MQSKTVSVKQKILNVTHNSDIDRPYWELAQFLLLHYNEMGKLNTRTLAEQCHTSFSTVRRFCQSMGYDNFADLQKARLANPENQYQIAVDNCRSGQYEPRFLYDEIMKNLWNLGQKIDLRAADALADAMAAADSVIIIALRPYYFILQEFQSQMVSLNKPVYIFSDVGSRAEIISRLGSRRCFIVISPAGILFPAVDSALLPMDGQKAAVYCPATLSREKGDFCLPHYDLTFPIPSHRSDYNYLEIFGKYAVSCFFDILLGVFIRKTT
jgi:hypothetical protein